MRGRRQSSGFFIDHNSRDPERIKQRLEQIRKAVPATTDSPVVTSSSTAIVAWVGLLKQLLVDCPQVIFVLDAAPYHLWRCPKLFHYRRHKGMNFSRTSVNTTCPPPLRKGCVSSLLWRMASAIARSSST